MRAFLDAILAFIGAASLADIEYNSIDQTDMAVSVYNLACYTQLAIVLVNRESVSTTTDRLRWFFMSKGVDVPATSTSRSNIFIGDAL